MDLRDDDEWFVIVDGIDDFELCVHQFIRHVKRLDRCHWERKTLERRQVSLNGLMHSYKVMPPLKVYTYTCSFQKGDITEWSIGPSLN